MFVNCPFDADFRQMMLAMVFTIQRLNFHPRLALERNNSAESRIQKIVGLIEESKFGLHDLSRMESKAANELARMNMPFELGIDFGCKHLKIGKWSEKKILILDSGQYRYQAALSDLAGSDIRSHKNKTKKAIREVRDWLVVESRQAGPSFRSIWSDFNYFNSFLADELEKIGAKPKDIDQTPVAEVMRYMELWFDTRDSSHDDVQIAD